MDNLIRNISFSTVPTLFIIAIIIIFIRKDNIKPLLFFSFIITQIGIATTCTILLNIPIPYPYFQIALLFNKAVFLFGPTLLLYTLSFFNPQLKIRFYHLIPYLILIGFLLYYLYIALFTDMTFKDTGIFIFRFTELIVNLFYFIIIPFYLKSKGIPFKRFIFSFYNSNFFWLSFLYLNCIILYGIKIITYFIYIELEQNKLYQTAVIIYSIYSLVFFILFLYFIITKRQMIQEVRKYKNSHLSDIEKKQLMKKIENFMISEKPYINPDISLSEMARLISIPPKKISQIINIGYGANFYHYINTYRIKDAIKLLENPEAINMTILEILYSVGFNSKSTFNSAFKRYTGLSPKTYRQKAVCTADSIKKK